MKANARQYAESLTAAQAAGKQNAQELVKGLMGVLRKKGESKLAKKILAHLVEAEAEQQGRVEVTIETAHPTNKETQQTLIKKTEALYPNKEVQASFHTQPELGAGFRIRGKGKEIDQSFATQLKKLRNTLTHL